MLNFHHHRLNILRLIVLPAFVLAACLSIPSVVNADGESTIAIGTAEIGPGESVEVPLEIEIADGEVRTIELTIGYDETVVDATACNVPADSPLSSAQCNTELEGEVRLIWGTGSDGLTGTHVLTITFAAVGASGTSSALELGVDLFGDELEDVPVTPQDGQIRIQSAEEVTAVESVTISGPTSGGTDMDHTFSAQITPADATEPVDYEWTPEPKSGQGTPTATYSWPQIGVQEISVTVANDNGGASASDTHSIEIAAPSALEAAEEPTNPTSYRIFVPMIARE